jgi:hypothetical protein
MSTATLSDDLKTLLEKKEDLHPELAPYLFYDPGIGYEILKHPLYFEIFYNPAMNALINDRYLKKKEYVAENESSGKWGSAIWMHERPCRFNAFRKYMENMTDEEYWSILGDIWIDSENLWQVGSYVLRNLLGSTRPGRHLIMDEEDREFLGKLPGEFTIYRGHQNKNKRGFSWTLDHLKARWFSDRLTHGNRQYVARATVRKSDVVAYFGGRSEFEIVVDPRNLEIESLRKPRRPGWLKPVYDYAVGVFKLNAKTSYHGPSHWDQVERNVIKLAKLTPGADMKVCRLFAVLHDCKRENEDRDPKHGVRAAALARQLESDGKFHLDYGQFGLLDWALSEHNDGKTTADPTVGCCWDADRLDLPRVGIVPDKNLLSTDAGKSMIWRM